MLNWMFIVLVDETIICCCTHTHYHVNELTSLCCNSLMLHAQYYYNKSNFNSLWFNRDRDKMLHLRQTFSGLWHKGLDIFWKKRYLLERLWMGDCLSFNLLWLLTLTHFLKFQIVVIKHLTDWSKTWQVVADRQKIWRTLSGKIDRYIAWIVTVIYRLKNAKSKGSMKSRINIDCNGGKKSVFLRTINVIDFFFVFGMN